VRFIAEHADRTDGGLRWGVEPICRVLSEHGCPVAPSTYYDARTAAERGPSPRGLRDERLKSEIRRVHQDNYGVYGARKVWLALNREGIAVARCTVERLMRELGLAGARRGRRIRTTVVDAAAARPADLVRREFDPPAPNRTWVADFTYVPTWSGMVYVAFVLDAYSRRILGWRAARSMKTTLVLDALEQAVWTRTREGVVDLSGLVHHTDAGSQYTSIAFTERLAQVGIDPSVGSVGDAYDNALAESVIGLYKTECVRRDGPIRSVEDLELATASWVHWFNTHRLHSMIGNLPPIEYEQNYYAHQPARDDPISGEPSLH
jgi:putative transposase